MNDGAIAAVWGRRLRWWLGRGWDARDFAARYRAGGEDAWGYRQSEAHRRRADAILAALPAPRFGHALEVGCAQGFLSQQLAARCDRLTACDFSADALEGARAACAGHDHVNCRLADIRAGFPGAGFDLALFSDVLYYLTPREIDAVLIRAETALAPGGYLVVANEWAGARGLTSPEYALTRLERAGNWTGLARQTLDLGRARLFLGVFRLRDASEAIQRERRRVTP